MTYRGDPPGPRMSAPGSAPRPRLIPSRIPVGDTELECVWMELDEAARPTLVFLHEGLGSVSMWRDFPARLCLSTGCNGLMYSRAGYGNSSPLAGARGVEFMHNEAQSVLPLVLAAFSIERPVLIGHSDGGSIALIYSALHAERALATIVLAPHIMVEAFSLREIRAARVAFEQGDLRARLARHHADVDGAFYGWNNIWLDPAFGAWSIEDLLGSIRAPLLAVQGFDDPYGTMLQIDGIRARVPRATLLKLPHCGHAPHRDQPETVLREVMAFLEMAGTHNPASRPE